MIQKKFLCKNVEESRSAITQIGAVLDNTPHKSALVTFYEKGFTRDEISSIVNDLKSCSKSDLLVAGLSVTLVAELMPDGNGILFNLLLTEDADIEVVSVPCLPGQEEEAAQKLRARLDSSDHVRAVELFGSNMELNTTLFMNGAMKGHEDAPLFGTSTIRNLPTKLSVEKKENIVEVEHLPEEYEQNEFIVANEIMDDGFAAVIFSGKRLEVCTEYALGWNPIGPKLSCEFGSDPARGETVITRINDMPAVDIYREYLGVYPDSYLISNVCEFPFVVERNGINICLIPIDCGKDGELYFMMTVNEGEQIRFTFASHDEVLNASRRSLENMERFGPEALFLTLCGNRINFLKEDAHIEWDSFNAIAPDHALMHGSCELLYHKGRGGILNSAHLAVGFREKDDPVKRAKFDHSSVDSLRHGRVLSLSDRMSVFLSRITNELIDTAKEAEDANNAKSAFLSHMSHEIRTPINAILGMNEMILQESGDPTVLEYAEGIRSSGSNLLSIVNDILDYSRIEAGKLSIIPVEYELSSLINDLRNVVFLRASDKGLSVILDIDPVIPMRLVGDEMRLKQVITNLLTNAVKYTESGSVTLGMKLLEDDGDSVRLRIFVTDTGIGIRPEDMEKLFAEYERIEERRNRTIEGTGLGLSIASELLELMGSKLCVTSTYGKGSEFYFEITQGDAGEAPIGDIDSMFKGTAGIRHHSYFTAKSAHILVVDDSAVNLTVVRNLLKKTGIKIDSALSGAQAIELVRDNEYDMIFLDHLMPGMDGNETLIKMKQLETKGSALPPVIALSADVAPESVEEYLRTGYSAFLAKPINPRELEDMLLGYLPYEKVKIVSSDE